MIATEKKLSFHSVQLTKYQMIFLRLLFFFFFYHNDPKFEREFSRSEEPWHQPANLPRRIFFWLARQAKNDDSVLFINEQDTVIRVRAMSCRVERLRSATDPIKTVTQCCYRFAFACVLSQNRPTTCPDDSSSRRVVAPTLPDELIKTW